MDYARSSFRSLVGMLQTGTDKPATTLNPKSMFSYPVHVAKRKFTKDYRRYLIDLIPFSAYHLYPQMNKHNRHFDNLTDAGSEFASESIVTLADKLPKISEKNGKKYGNSSSARSHAKDIFIINCVF